ncbi:transcription termination/antitermination protein NusG [Blattabacterium cuenoti]|uniref:transcription termination/antitermination protein NusG n=1 Tax=Blattabacterium cuenoti TaxID=1653831 RepID=UPI00163C115B|nr:transcription termination/antitermination protein NusG [Blattabacterium cuenoti]
MNNLEKKWYVIKTISGRENKIKLYIENEVKNNGLEKEIGDILVPTEKIIQIKNGKKIYKDKVYYPGYVMIEANLEGEALYAIRNVPGVITFLGEGKGSKSNPVPMRKNEISKILGKIENSLEEFENNIEVPFVIGETIKVIDGPFSGFNGTIEKINEEKRKLELAVLIFGRKTPLELNFTQIEKI